MTYNILVIDDDPNIIDSFELITGDLDNCKLFTVTKFSKVMKIVDNNVIDLAFIDIILPDTDGYEVCKELKKHQNTSKAYFILMSSDKKHLLDRIRAYKVGAQEFLDKPFDLKETEMIVKSKMAFFSQSHDEVRPLTETVVHSSEIYTSGKFVIDNSTQEVMMENEKIALTAMEFSLLRHFIYNPEKLIDLPEIVNEIWGNLDQGNFDNARGLIYRLRAKIEPEPKAPVYIVSKKYSASYMFYPFGTPSI